MSQYISFSSDGSNSIAHLTKEALLFFTGTHKDRKGNAHEFSEERLQKIADNSNRKLESGARIPWQEDHKKGNKDTLGDLSGPVYTKIITQADLTNPRHTHLLGRLGLFTKDLVAKGKEVVDRVTSGAIKTLSAGIDPSTEALMEISATPFPALLGCELYSSQDGESHTFEYAELVAFKKEPYRLNKEWISFSEITPNSTVEEKEQYLTEKSKTPQSMQEALGIQEEDNKKSEEYGKLSHALGKVLITLHQATDESLKGKNPVEESYKAIEYFNKELEKLFNLVEPEKEENMGLGGSKTDNSIVQRRNNFSSDRKKVVNFSRRY